MEAYAVIETGGKQYRVQAGESLEVERLAVEKGAQTDLASVLARSDGAALTVGTPMIAGAKVTTRNDDTNIVRATLTNEVGEYTIPLLQPGAYSVSAEASRFRAAVGAAVGVAMVCLLPASEHPTIAPGI